MVVVGVKGVVPPALAFKLLELSLLSLSAEATLNKIVPPTVITAVDINNTLKNFSIFFLLYLFHYLISCQFFITVLGTSILLPPFTFILELTADEFSSLLESANVIVIDNNIVEIKRITGIITILIIFNMRTPHFEFS
ncbi:MAG: hypothetical protein HZA77_02380 [Candidatus Schekmanbacteria bacterium]|nr:hypothetical protein [Candidatus Schekmanbacteria bacterium]